VRISDRGGELLIRVRDWGPGIPPERVASIFRSGYSTKSDHVGLGLGLVQTIVSRAGGRIEVGHPPGDGVAIAVRIPFT
jgi:two-component system CitB family sensor kinase